MPVPCRATDRRGNDLGYRPRPCSFDIPHPGHACAQKREGERKKKKERKKEDFVQVSADPAVVPPLQYQPQPIDRPRYGNQAVHQFYLSQNLSPLLHGSSTRRTTTSRIFPASVTGCPLVDYLTVSSPRNAMQHGDLAPPVPLLLLNISVGPSLIRPGFALRFPVRRSSNIIWKYIPINEVEAKRAKCPN